MFNIKTVPQIKIREGVSGDAKIIKRGTGYELYINDEIFMGADTATSEQIRQFYSSYDLASGDVLLTGLGFGILPLWVASKPSVTSATVVEKSQGVVDLFLANNQLPSNMTIEVCDAYEYKTSRHFDCILLDHYELNMLTPEQAAVIADNIPNHDLMWPWAIELLIGDTSWEEIVEKYPIKLPSLAKDKLEEYLETYPKRMVNPPKPPLDYSQQVPQAINLVLDIS